jgi:hypothetical protein
VKNEIVNKNINKLSAYWLMHILILNVIVLNIYEAADAPDDRLSAAGIIKFIAATEPVPFPSCLVNIFLQIIVIIMSSQA